MADQATTRDATLIRYLSDAHGKERELETALQAHLAMTTHEAYRERLREHLAETREQAQRLERRIEQLGGKVGASDVPGPEVAGEAVAAMRSWARKGVSLAKGPLHALRGSGAAEKELKNAKTELTNESEEIGNYLAIEELAKRLGDDETAGMARDFRAQEERMAAFLRDIIPTLARQVADESASKSSDGASAPA